ncbi:MAG: DUF418 domain-containing protein [Flavobacterium sp.]|uniref:DUF418 domain-containing protein n=1 Tax=Flavobacterium sp. TaxID=239 RepID=UPI001B2D35BC|nr:DUF418 domain-containing protein [Flavobacterium sp.]MBO9583152.1 DUF418 domain-containing protein [Flavobacterium sp.]
MTNSFQPIEENKRTAIVDILRGWALLGVVIGNYVDFRYIGLEKWIVKKGIFSQVISYTNLYFFSAKSWTLLSILFGYGFAVLINNVAEKGKNPVSFFCWRMFILFLLAFINSAFWLGDILKDYALLGLFLLLFYRSSAKIILISSILIFLAIPFINAYVNTFKQDLPDVQSTATFLKLFYSGNWISFFQFNLMGTYFQEMINLPYAVTVHFVMFDLMLFGFYLQKINFFNRLPEFKRLLKQISIVCFILAIISGVLFEIAINQKFVFTYFHPVYWIIINTMFFIASGICLLYTNGKLKTIFNLFRVSGKMTLSNYMAQNILAAFIFSGIGLKVYNNLPYWFYFFLAISVFIAQLFISKWWLSKFNYGPVEWLWRVLSYRKMFPLKKEKVSNNIISKVESTL